MTKFKPPVRSRAEKPGKKATVAPIEVTASPLTRRKNLRYAPDPGAIAQIDFEVGRKTPFKPTMTGLVTEESYRGVGLVVLADRWFEIGARFRVAVGKASPMLAEVRWRMELDSQVLRVGLMYIETT